MTSFGDEATAANDGADKMNAMTAALSQKSVQLLRDVENQTKMLKANKKLVTEAFKDVIQQCKEMSAFFKKVGGFFCFGIFLFAGLAA